MAELIELQQIPSQQFSVTLGDNNYDIRIYMLDYSMAYDLSINEVEVINGFKFMHEIPMLVYAHQELDGNLLLVIPDDEEADYDQFGVTQFLVYLSQDEIDAYRETNDL